MQLKFYIVIECKTLFVGVYSFRKVFSAEKATFETADENPSIFSLNCVFAHKSVEMRLRVSPL